jgi:hypothetical protein
MGVNDGVKCLRKELRRQPVDRGQQMVDHE